MTAPPKPPPPRAKRPYHKPKVEVVELSTEQALLGVCVSNPNTCRQPYTQSQVPLPAPLSPEEEP